MSKKLIAMLLALSMLLCLLAGCGGDTSASLLRKSRPLL